MYLLSNGYLALIVDECSPLTSELVEGLEIELCEWYFIGIVFARCLAKWQTSYAVTAKFGQGEEK